MAARPAISPRDCPGASGAHSARPPLLALAGLLLLLGCDAPAREAAPAPGPAARAEGPGRVSLMTFNVENLFDARKDAGKLDHTFLPLSLKAAKSHKAACARVKSGYRRGQCLRWDWSERTVRTKLRHVAEVVLQVDEGRGPDILVLQEVENEGVLERLRSEFLGKAAYRPGILIEGDDIRGIDTALLSRLEPVGKPRLHKIPYAGMTPAQSRTSRGVLEAAFLLPGGRPLTVFALHLPAPTHPRGFREQALRFLNARLAALPPGSMAAAAGDFNITAEEDARFRLYHRIAGPSWIAAHRIGCRGCPGTNHYGKGDSWSFLDTVLLSRSLAPEGGAPWTVVPESVRLANRLPEQKGRYGTPARFDPVGGTGVSDHWPLVLELSRRR